MKIKSLGSSTVAVMRELSAEHDVFYWDKINFLYNNYNCFNIVTHNVLYL